MLRERLLEKAMEIMNSRRPDFEIGPPGDRYMLRWYVSPWSRYVRGSKPKNWFDGLTRRLPSIYLHEFLHDDEDRALHDHPWPSLSFLLRGNYWEVMFYPQLPETIESMREVGQPRPTVKVFRPEGKVTVRGSGTAHRIVLEKRAGRLGRTESVRVISLFVTGFAVRRWGFWCARGFVPWEKFVAVRDKGAVGAGCGED